VGGGRATQHALIGPVDFQRRWLSLSNPRIRAAGYINTPLSIRPNKRHRGPGLKPAKVHAIGLLCKHDRSTENHRQRDSFGEHERSSDVARSRS
jgi:hypothetical protein